MWYSSQMELWQPILIWHPIHQYLWEMLLIQEVFWGRLEIQPLQKVD